MFAQPEEETFFISHLTSDQKVLEYGAGASTNEISLRVKEIVSMEHQQDWYYTLLPKIPSNCKLFLEKPNLPYKEGGHCGTYEEFKNYIERPLEFAPYDIILIDGRARVSCSSICNRLGHKNTIVFIHDFGRLEYAECNNYLNLIETVNQMGKFSIKF
jgi:hypothetical protein